MKPYRTLIIVFLLGWLLLVAVDGQTAEQQSVAVVVSENLTLTIPRAEALELFHLYERHEVTHPEDVQMYTALQLALGAGGKKELVYDENEETWAARKLREWQVRKD
jgi:hypothetical protein